MDKIKVIIADDSDFVRDGMRIILEVDEEFEVIGCARNGREAIEIAKESTPDIFLMDIQMPEMDGIEATKYIVENNMGKVLILTTFDFPQCMYSLLLSVHILNPHFSKFSLHLISLRLLLPPYSPS